MAGPFQGQQRRSGVFVRLPPGAANGKPPGGQKGHVGNHLELVDDPDETQILGVDRDTLPEGNYQEAGFEIQQVIDVNISRFVTEYQAQILVNESGGRFVAPFPETVSARVQYGIGVKVNAVYMSQFQLIPYNRIEDYFADPPPGECGFGLQF